MGERRILVLGSNRLGLSIAALLAARNIDAVVLQSPPEPTAMQKADAIGTSVNTAQGAIKTEANETKPNGNPISTEGENHDPRHQHPRASA